MDTVPYESTDALRQRAAAEFALTGSKRGPEWRRYEAREKSDRDHQWLRNCAEERACLFDGIVVCQEELGLPVMTRDEFSRINNEEAAALRSQLIVAMRTRFNLPSPDLREQVPVAQSVENQIV